MNAVPSDAPRFCAVPWSPPASFVWSGGAADMMTLPSWEASSPAPTPKMARPIAKPKQDELLDQERGQARAKGLDANQREIARISGSSAITLRT